MQRHNVLIACSSQKLDHRSHALSLYTSPLFQMSFAYARRLSVYRIFILSAKYGLIEPGDIIEPYNLTLHSMPAPRRRAWAEDVLKSLRARTDMERDTFTFLAGTKYREHLVGHLSHVEVPMEGLGIGRQLQFLNLRIHGSDGSAAPEPAPGLARRARTV